MHHDFERGNMRLFMELLPSTLEKYMKSLTQPIEVKMIRRILTEAGRAIKFLHSLKPPVIHRDIKVIINNYHSFCDVRMELLITFQSNNIFVSIVQGGLISLKIGDFGTLIISFYFFYFVFFYCV